MAKSVTADVAPVSLDPRVDATQHNTQRSASSASSVSGWAPGSSAAWAWDQAATPSTLNPLVPWASDRDFWNNRPSLTAKGRAAPRFLRGRQLPKQERTASLAVWLGFVLRRVLRSGPQELAQSKLLSDSREQFWLIDIRRHRSSELGLQARHGQRTTELRRQACNEQNSEGKLRAASATCTGSLDGTWTLGNSRFNDSNFIDAPRAQAPRRPTPNTPGRPGQADPQADPRQQDLRETFWCVKSEGSALGGDAGLLGLLVAVAVVRIVPVHWPRKSTTFDWRVCLSVVN